MFGCDYNPACLEEFCENGTPVVFENIEAFARWGTSTTHNQVVDDVAQLCGGAGDTAALLVKRGYKDGPNYDIVVGIDHMREDGRSYLRGYLRRRRPNIVLISTPCTGMKGFSALNRAINHAAWVRCRRVSVPLGKLAGEVAYIQLRVGLHFIAEHPQGSAMFQLPIWKMLSREPQVVKVLVHQCMTGLRGPRSGLPIKNPSEVWASDEELVAPLRGLLCDGSHEHSQLDAREAGAPADKAKDAARWALPLCHRAARGSEHLLLKWLASSTTSRLLTSPR